MLTGRAEHLRLMRRWAQIKDMAYVYPYQMIALTALQSMHLDCVTLSVGRYGMVTVFHALSLRGQLPSNFSLSVCHKAWDISIPNGIETLVLFGIYIDNKGQISGVVQS